MEIDYQIVPLTNKDKKYIIVILSLFSSPGIIILLTFVFLGIYLNSKQVFLDGLPIILAGIILPYLFSLRYIGALMKNEKYIIRGILTFKEASPISRRYQDVIYSIDHKDKFITSSIGATLCDSIYEGNIAEMHLLPFMFAKRKMFYIKRINESYEIISTVNDIEINTEKEFAIISFSDLGEQVFYSSFFYNTIKKGDLFSVKVTPKFKTGKPVFTFKPSKIKRRK